MLAGTASPYKATIVRAGNPYCHALDRQIYALDEPVAPRVWAQRVGIDTQRSMLCVNGDYWLRQDWDRELPHGAIAAFIPVPAGGGGSNPLNAVLLIAVAIASAYTAGAVGAAYGAAYGAAAGAAVGVAGSLLVNAIVPISAVGTSVTGASTSPTYSLQASGNTARLLESIPVVYGRLNTVPDLAAQPYTEYVGNEQYLYELFAISQGQISIEQILIGETPIGNFSEIDYEIVGPNQPVTLFPDNVVTSSEISGIELQAPNDSGDWVGPFVANPSGSEANFIGIDVTLPSGLFYAADDGSLQQLSLTFEIQAQAIDDNGNAAGDWFDLDMHPLTMATSQPQLISYRYPVAQARYQIRARRTTDLNTDSRAQNRIEWAALRAYLPSERYYGDVTLLALRARATNSLNSNSAHDVHIISTRMLPIWNGSTWSAPQATTNPAWAIADAVRNTSYGAGLADKRLDLDVLLTLAQTWATRGDEFNGVFDTKGSFWDTLSTICRAGRALPMYFGGVISVVRDELKTVRTAMFTPQNIVKGSFSAQYSFNSADTPDYVTIEYFDEATWAWQTVDCAPTGSPMLVQKSVKMVGPTKRAQAFREGLYMAYANRDQRKTVSITTELDGLIPRYGDLVSISHDLPKWGISGVVEAFDGYVVTVSEQLEWTPAAQHYVRFVERDGTPTDAIRVSQPVGDTDDLSMRLMDSLPQYFEFSDGFSEEPTRFAFGPALDKITQDVRLIKATPRDGQVEMTFINNADSPHTAETGVSPPPPVSPSLLSGVIHAPIVASIAIDFKITPGDVSITAAPAAGAARYEYQASADNGVSWSLLGIVSTNTLTAPVAVGTWQFRVRAYGASGLAGPFAVWTGAIEEFKYAPAPPVLSLREPFTGNQLSIEIQRLPEVDFFQAEVVVGGVSKYSATITAQNFTWTLEQAQQYGAVADTFDVRVEGGNIAGLGNPATITVKSTPPDAPNVSYAPGMGGNATIAYSSAATVQAVGYVVRQGGTVLYDGPETSLSVAAGETYTVTAYNSWHSESAPASIDIPTDAGEGGGTPDPGGGGGGGT
ncbi:host specificity factor TipJ family phage tail protein [Caballeronia sp. dw_19]|uniref:host specificity factor TipJ family phage tail protein n=1 Tax=Caballeronia sp. dw_19 TaxID=2719791 RepID=UPI001BD04957